MPINILSDLNCLGVIHGMDAMAWHNAKHAIGNSFLKQLRIENFRRVERQPNAFAYKAQFDKSVRSVRHRGGAFL